MLSEEVNIISASCDISLVHLQLYGVLASTGLGADATTARMTVSGQRCLITETAILDYGFNCSTRLQLFSAANTTLQVEVSIDHISYDIALHYGHFMSGLLKEKLRTAYPACAIPQPANSARMGLMSTLGEIEAVLQQL
jgi:hypothetical protein